MIEWLAQWIIDLDADYEWLGYSLRVVDYLTLLPDAVEIASAALAWLQHLDLYNTGRISGKLFKLTVQLAMNGAFTALYKMVLANQASDVKPDLLGLLKIFGFDVYNY